MQTEHRQYDVVSDISHDVIGFSLVYFMLEDDWPCRYCFQTACRALAHLVNQVTHFTFSSPKKKKSNTGGAGAYHPQRETCREWQSSTAHR